MASRSLLLLAFFFVAIIALVQAKSACEEHRDREAKNTGASKLDVRCAANGEYAPLQCFPSTKFCYCSSPTGEQLTSPNKNRKFCACEMKKAEVMKKLGKGTNGRPVDPPSGSWVPKCQRDGLYYGKQCETGTNICWCVNAEGVQSSKDKKVGITCA